jgi:malate dehydrogenase (oxaloacetate-decarboxylating)(NADP+)
MANSRDLSLAYSPGVAYPCLDIHNNPERAYELTVKGNTVAVISNGTAVLGLGNLGALASKPVMEGKAVLFGKFAGIQSVDICVDAYKVDDFINCVRYLGPSFGGINLEDIRGPDCFVIEERLKSLMNIPVFHDDQHGTAIICLAALINAVEFSGKKFEDLRVVCNGAGAAGIACVKLI